VTIRDFRHVTSVAASHSLAFFGTTAGLERLDTLRDRWLAPVTVADGLPDDRVTALAADPTSGDAWIGTARGLARLVAFVDVVEPVFGPPPFRVDRLLVDPGDGSVWALVGGSWWTGRGGSPVLERAPGSPPFARLAGPIPVDEVDPARLPWTDPLWVDTPLVFGTRVRLTVLDRDRRGDWFVGTWGDNGRRWRLSTQTWEPLYFGLAGAAGGPIAASASGYWFLPRSGSSRPPAADVSLAPGRVRIGLAGGSPAPVAVARANRALGDWRYAVPVEVRGLPAAESRAALASGDTVWLATDHGVVRGIGDRWERWGSGAPARALAFDGGLLWVGAEDGLEALDRASGASIARLLSGRRVSALAVTPEAVYAGTATGLFAGRRPLPAAVPAGIERVDARGSSIRSLAVTDTLLFVASEVGLEVFDRLRGAWSPMAAGEGRAGDILALATDPSGQVWIGTTAGLSRLRPDTGEWDDWTPADGLAGVPVFHLLAEDGVVWASTPGGVSRFAWREAGR
jgi:ligand-binding sensor domain-containing protein